MEIPFCVHQIWIQGDRSTMPPHVARLTEWTEKVVKMEKGEYRLWSEADVSPWLQTDPELKKVYETAPSFAAKSDIVRLLILSHHGGLYLDTDIFILRPHELRWLISASSIATLVAPYLWEEDDDCFAGVNRDCPVCTNNCVLASTIDSPWIAQMLENVRKAPLFSSSDDSFRWTLQSTGPEMVRRVLFGTHGHTSETCRLIPRSLLQQSTPLSGNEIMKQNLDELRTRLCDLHPTAVLLHTQDRSWIHQVRRVQSDVFHSQHRFIKRHATMLYYVTIGSFLILLILLVKYIWKQDISSSFLFSNVAKRV